MYTNRVVNSGERMWHLQRNKDFEILSKARDIVPMKVLLLDMDYAFPALTRVGLAFCSA